MATEKQIIANRLNGKKGGPKTNVGKRRSSRNALKHYLTSTSPVVQTNWHKETIEERERFREKMMQLLAPRDELLELSAGEIIDIAWRLHRYKKLEEAVSSDTFVKLQLGDTLNELTAAVTQIRGAQRTISTLQHDINIIENIVSSDLFDPQNNDWWIDLIHVRAFLEKSLLFGRDNYTDSLNLITIAESIDTIVNALCTERNITLKTLMKNFLEYLQEQFLHWTNELRRLSASYEQLLNQEGREVTESSYILEVASHSLLQQAQGQYNRLQRTFFRMLKDYKKVNIPNVAEHDIKT
jgi:hypothetical protein